MSIRYLYKTIPRDKRICCYYLCEKPILRNIARDTDGRIYHYGCLNTAKDEQHRYLDCGGGFNGTEVALDNPFGETVVICPFCGSHKTRRVTGGED